MAQWVRRYIVKWKAHRCESTLYETEWLLVGNSVSRFQALYLFRRHLLCACHVCHWGRKQQICNFLVSKSSWNLEEELRIKLTVAWNRWETGYYRNERECVHQLQESFQQVLTVSWDISGKTFPATPPPPWRVSRILPYPSPSKQINSHFSLFIESISMSLLTHWSVFATPKQYLQCFGGHLWT